MRTPKSEATKQHDRRVGFWLRTARELRGLKQQEVARLIGLSERSGSTLVEWERGRRSVPVERLATLASVYEMPVEVFTDPDATPHEWLDRWASTGQRPGRAHFLSAVDTTTTTDDLQSVINRLAAVEREVVEIRGGHHYGQNEGQ